MTGKITYPPEFTAEEMDCENSHTIMADFFDDMFPNDLSARDLTKSMRIMNTADQMIEIHTTEDD